MTKHPALLRNEVSHPSHDIHVPVFTFAGLILVTIAASIALILAFHYLGVIRVRRRMAAETTAQAAEQERQRAVDRFCRQVQLDVAHWEQERAREAMRREEENLPPYSREPKLPSFSEIEQAPVDRVEAETNGTGSDSVQITSNRETMSPPSY